MIGCSSGSLAIAESIRVAAVGRPDPTPSQLNPQVAYLRVTSPAGLNYLARNTNAEGKTYYLSAGRETVTWSSRGLPERLTTSDYDIQISRPLFPVATVLPRSATSPYALTLQEHRHQKLAASLLVRLVPISADQARPKALVGIPAERLIWFEEQVVRTTSTTPTPSWLLARMGYEPGQGNAPPRLRYLEQCWQAIDCWTMQVLDPGMAF